MARNEHHPASSQHRLTAPHRTSFPTTNLPNIPPTYHAECCTTCSRRAIVGKQGPATGTVRHRQSTSVRDKHRTAPRQLSHPQPPEHCVSPNKGDNVSLVADTPILAEHRPGTGIAPHHRSTSTRDGHRAAPAPPPVTSRAYISTDIKCKPSRRHSNTCKARARNEHHPVSSQHRLTTPHRTSSPTTNPPNIRPT